MTLLSSHAQIKVPGEFPAGHSVSGPEENTIHLWAFSLEAATAFMDRCKQALPESESQRIDFFKFNNAKDNFQVSQGGLRLLLSAYLGIDALKLRIGRHPKGKPFSLDDPKLQFNMTNSGKWVLYAFSRSSEVGIDLEYLRNLSDLGELIQRNFSEKEQRYINKLPAGRQGRFFKFWTVKEAYLKAIGEGMRLPPENLEFSVDNGKFRLESVKGFYEQDQWHFDEADLDDTHVGTVAHKLEAPVFVKMNF